MRQIRIPVSMSVSSLGSNGGTHFTPIINAPEVEILGVGRAATQPVWSGVSTADPAAVALGGPRGGRGRCRGGPLPRASGHADCELPTCAALTWHSFNEAQYSRRT
jgi:hypothetical protein